MRLSAFVLWLAAGAGGMPASAQRFSRAGKDMHERIVGLTTNDSAVLIAPVGSYAHVELSDDGRTVLWRVTSRLRDADAQRVETVSRRIEWYRAGRRHEYSAGEVFVRDAWLVDSGRRIGVNYGGLHFAGRNVLLDANTGNVLASFADADKTKKPVPAWVR